MKIKTQKPAEFRRSACPVANTLDLIGDKWTLLIIRDMRHGKRTYGELADSPEGIPTNILADRLKRLEGAGIIVRTAYQDRPARYAYTLSEKGKDLGALLLALVSWGKKHIPGTRTSKEAAADSPRKEPSHRLSRARGKVA
jgi:DNA-binding HxlR family transcriptional regulator